MGVKAPPMVRDAVYTVVGFGVLGFQRLQVARRDVQRQVRAGVQAAVPAARGLARRVDAVADPVLDRVERLVPEPGRLVLHVARVTARSVLQPPPAR
jgi:hypothetical protein